MGILDGILNASESSGGSAQHNVSNAQGQSYAVTNGTEASQWSARQAEIARDWSADQAELNRQFQERMFEKEMAFNAAEAQKARDFNQAQVDVANRMADTVYTRASANMKEAGINPILAYSQGLAGVGTGSVSSGQSASVGAPAGSQAQSFMGQAFADQHSASSQYSHGEGSGSSWEHSQSGLTTAAEQLAGMFGRIASGLSSGLKVDLGSSIDRLVDLIPKTKNNTNTVSNMVNNVKKEIDNSKETQKLNAEDRRNRVKERIDYFRKYKKLPEQSNGAGRKF